MIRNLTAGRLCTSEGRDYRHVTGVAVCGVVTGVL